MHSYSASPPHYCLVIVQYLQLSYPPWPLRRPDRALLWYRQSFGRPRTLTRIRRRSAQQLAIYREQTPCDRSSVGR
jgi:hypothetical protein